MIPVIILSEWPIASYGSVFLQKSVAVPSFLIFTKTTIDVKKNICKAGTSA